jgi:hypothetical protein
MDGGINWIKLLDSLCNFCNISGSSSGSIINSTIISIILYIVLTLSHITSLDQPASYTTPLTSYIYTN